MESGTFAVGKKLDFLMQEMHREANSLGVKCQDLEIIQLSVMIKSELEKIRDDGYALDESAFLEGFIGIAVPVINSKNKTFATITAHGPASRMLEKSIDFYLRPLQQAAQDIQSSLSETNT